MTELLWYHYALAISVGVYVFQLALAELIYRLKGPIPDGIERTSMTSSQAWNPIGRNPSAILTIPMIAPQFGVVVFSTYALAGATDWFWMWIIAPVAVTTAIAYIPGKELVIGEHIKSHPVVFQLGYMIFGLALAGPVATRSMFAATTINGISPYQALMPAMLVGAAIGYTVLDAVAAYTLPLVTDSPDQQDASE